MKPTTIVHPRFVLFDWDNTLVDSWPVIHECYCAVFDDLGMTPWTLAEVKERAHGSLRDFFPVLFGDRWQSAADVFFATFHRIHLQRLQPMSGAPELLQELRALDVQVGVVSNKVGKNLRVETQHLGWDRHFHRVVGATDALRDKPAPDPIHMALEGSGIAPGQEVWMVGDTRADLVCAHAAGCVPVLLREDIPSDDEFSDCPPAIHARDCHALRALLLAKTDLY